MHRLGLNQVLQRTCVTRSKSHKSESNSLFVKHTRFHVLKLVSVRSVRRHQARHAPVRTTIVCPGCPCLNRGSETLWPNSVNLQIKKVQRPSDFSLWSHRCTVTKSIREPLGSVKNLARPALEEQPVMAEAPRGHLLSENPRTDT